MPFRKSIREKNNYFKSSQRSGMISTIINDNRQTGILNNEKHSSEDISNIYFAISSPIKTVIDILRSISENQAKISLLILEVLYLFS